MLLMTKPSLLNLILVVNILPSKIPLMTKTLNNLTQPMIFPGHTNNSLIHLLNKKLIPIQ